MTGTASRSLYGNAYRPQVPSAGAASNGSHRSNSLRGHQATPPYKHTDKDEQLYNLVSDLSNACRNDSNANALKDFNLIETLEKSAKDILARRNNQAPSPETKTAAANDLIQKRRRLSIEGKSDDDDDDPSGPRFQKIERPAADTSSAAPKRYNMPTFFSAMPRQASNGSVPPSRSPSPLLGKDNEAPLKTKSLPQKPAQAPPAIFQDFSDPEDDEPSFMRDTISRDTFSRETGIYSRREALCMDDLSLDEINMIAPPAQEDLHRKRGHGAISFTQVCQFHHESQCKCHGQAKDDDIQSIMDKAKVSVNPDNATNSLRKKPEKEPEYTYTHMGSKLKSSRVRSGSGSKDRVRRSSQEDKKSITDAKLISINKTVGSTTPTNGSLQSSRAQLRSQTTLETKSTSWATSSTSSASSSTFKAPEKVKSVEKPISSFKPAPEKTVAAPVVEVTRQKPTPVRREVSLDDDMHESTKSYQPAPQIIEKPIVPADILKKIETLEKQLAQKTDECARLTTELMSQDTQWKTQFEASETAYKALEASVARLTAEKESLANQIADLESRIPSGDSTSNRIVWHLKEILREEEADNKIETARATKIAALVNRFEKSNAQVQADFAQQLRHEIKTIGITRSASLSVDSNNRVTTSELEEKIAEHEATIEALTREAQNYQNQLEMALQTAADRDQDVMQLERKLSSLQVTPKDATVQAVGVQKSRKLEDKIALLESAALQRDREKERLEEQVRELQRSLDGKSREDTKLADATRELEAQRAEVARLQQALEAKTKEFSAPQEISVMRDSFVRAKSVHFEDDDADSITLRTKLEKKEAEVEEMRAALYEKTCDINALKQEVMAKTETITHLSADFAERLETFTKSRRDSSGAPSDPEMEKMEMFLFNQVCAKQQEIDELIEELERKDQELQELAQQVEATRGAADTSALEAQHAELSSQVKLLTEQNSLLKQETEVQSRSIESKQRQIKSLIEQMQAKEAELSELDEALATAEMQVEHLKQQYNASFTQEEEESFAAAYREGGRRSSFSLRRNSSASLYSSKPTSAMDDGYDEYERPMDNLSVESGTSYMTKGSSAFEDDFAGSPRFSSLSPGRDSMVSRSSEWGLEF
ncbi:hypothetical protein LEN26_000978 [Aphanomyces euteiches]|nr:hypothetical protein LEN26_000978 [Aphanomyces euteiches]